MPLTTGLSIHDDTKHKGSAKRGGVDGVASLDSGQDVPMGELSNILPTGAVIMYHGLLANVPSGWQVCDGTNGTPDLRDTFVRGAANLADSGATGGSDTHSINIIDNLAGNAGTAIRKIDNVGNPNAAGNYTITNIPAYFALLYIMKL